MFAMCVPGRKDQDRLDPTFTETHYLHVDFNVM